VTKTLSFILLLCTLFCISCGPGKEAKTARALRNAGKYDEAHDYILTELKRNPDNMDLWREFVSVDAELARKVHRDQDPFSYIVKSCMICAAVFEQNPTPGSLWKAASTQAVNRAIAAVNSQLDIIRNCKAKYNASEREKKRIQNQFDELPEDIANRIQITMSDDSSAQNSEPLISAAEARSVVWKTRFYARLLQKLLGESDPVAGPTLQQIAGEVPTWPNFSDLDPSFITDIQTEADSAFQDAYSGVIFDLKNYGYFSVERITDMDILP
jgi:hypothetical protein